MYCIRFFKLPGFAPGKGKNGVYNRAHEKYLKKVKTGPKKLPSRSQCENA